MTISRDSFPNPAHEPEAAAIEAARLDDAKMRAAQLEAAKGGWPDAPSCAFRSGRKTFWAWTVATFFGAGLGKPGPGTWGSCAATLLWAIPALLLQPTPLPLLLWTLAGAILSTAIGIPAATIAARESGRKDPGFVVIDEVAGQWITLLAIPFAQLISSSFSTHARIDAGHILAALLLFRLFDVTKPFPVRNLEKLPEGTGIVFDDVAAGLYAGTVLLVISHWL
jgi:phosphatidylglycerophosphatase A